MKMLIIHQLISGMIPHKFYSGSKIKTNFSVKLLTMGSWPYNQTFTMEIPKVFEETLNNFTTFYHEKHTGRTLTWLYSQSKVPLEPLECRIFGKVSLNFVCLG